MAFPNTSVIDDFNRADTGPPPSGSWSAFTSGGGGGLKVVSNQLVSAGTDTQWSASAWGTQLGPNVEMFLTLPTLQAAPAEFQFDLRMSSLNASLTNGYSIEFNPPASTAVFRVTGGGFTKLGSNISMTLTAGDTVGVSMVGSLITIWQKPAAGSWAAVDTRSDSTYISAGYCIVWIKGNTWQADDFGAATFNPPGFTNFVAPSLSGALNVGGTLTVSNGTWQPTPGSYSHFWHRADDTAGANLVEIGATGSTYTLAAADTGKYIRAGVIPNP